MSETTEEVKLYLGHEAKDLVTGFSGIVDQQAWGIEGATKVSIQRKFRDDDKEYPNSYYFDSPTVEFGKRVEGLPEHKLPTFLYNFGDYVEDVVTGIRGLVVQKCFYLNGCIQYKVQLNVNDLKRVYTEVTEKSKDCFWAFESRLKLVREEEVKLPKSERRTGGPVERSYRC